MLWTHDYLEHRNSSPEFDEFREHVGIPYAKENFYGTGLTDMYSVKQASPAPHPIFDMSPQGGFDVRTAVAQGFDLSGRCHNSNISRQEVKAKILLTGASAPREGTKLPANPLPEHNIGIWLTVHEVQVPQTSVRARAAYCAFGHTIQHKEHPPPNEIECKLLINTCLFLGCKEDPKR